MTFSDGLPYWDPYFTATLAKGPVPEGAVTYRFAAQGSEPAAEPGADQLFTVPPDDGFWYSRDDRSPVHSVACVPAKSVFGVRYDIPSLKTLLVWPPGAEEGDLDSNVQRWPLVGDPLVQVTPGPTIGDGWNVPPDFMQVGISWGGGTYGGYHIGCGLDRFSGAPAGCGDAKNPVPNEYFGATVDAYALMGVDGDGPGVDAQPGEDDLVHSDDDTITDDPDYNKDDTTQEMPLHGWPVRVFPPESDGGIAYPYYAASVMKGSHGLPVSSGYVSFKPPPDAAIQSYYLGEPQNTAMRTLWPYGAFGEVFLNLGALFGYFSGGMTCTVSLYWLKTTPPTPPSTVVLGPYKRGVRAHHATVGRTIPG